MVINKYTIYFPTTTNKKNVTQLYWKIYVVLNCAANPFLNIKDEQPLNFQQGKVQNIFNFPL